MQFPKATVQKIELKSLFDADIELSVLREDLLHPFLSGNKWRKLKYNIEDFKNSKKKIILSFGGKFSNHLVACAAAGKMFQIPMIGILRGEEQVMNPNLEFLNKCGMRTISVSREDYRKRNEESFLDQLYAKCLQEFPDIATHPDDFFIIPEGGSNHAGMKGCMEIMDDVPDNISHICVASGTGTTLAGIAASTKANQEAIGIAVLHGETWMKDSLIQKGAPPDRTSIFFDYHFGGYAKTSSELGKFCLEFSNSTGIPIEPVYTGKLFYAIMDLIAKKHFPQGSKICLLHSGGIFDFNKTF